MIVSILLVAIALPVPTPVADAGLRGSVGVCIRWGIDPNHIADAVVVVGSGNPTLDQAVPATIKNMEWQRPSSTPYKGEWVGIVMAVDENLPNQPLPNCDGLPVPKPYQNDDTALGRTS